MKDRENTFIILLVVLLNAMWLALWPQIWVMFYLTVCVVSTAVLVVGWLTIYIIVWYKHTYNKR